MTFSGTFRNTAARLSDVVMAMIPSHRHGGMTTHDRQAAVFLRGNTPLFEALTGIVTSRLQGRATVQEPADPVLCKAIMARDGELRWILWKLDTLYRAPAAEHEADSGEPPAA